nr:MAG TPA: hypothetical protein [Caudoviricetes sp.]
MIVKRVSYFYLAKVLKRYETYKQSERKIKRQAYNEGIGRQFEHYHLDFVQVASREKHKILSQIGSGS